MRRVLIALIILAVIECVVVYFVDQRNDLQTSEIINIFGYSVVLGTLVVLYYQTKSGLTRECRRATHDFLHGPITHTLLPLEKELKKILGRKMLFFNESETITKTLAEHSDLEPQIHSLALDMLNFYERMAIAIRDGTLDSDTVYEDKGAQIINGYGWLRPLITETQQQYEPRAFANFNALIPEWRRQYQRESRRRTRKEARHHEQAALPRRGPFT